jgi:hypothetical protein
MPWLLLMVMLFGCHRAETGYNADIDACLAICATSECEDWCRACDRGAYPCIDDWKAREGHSNVELRSTIAHG